LVAGVMRGVGEPALLVKGGGSPHSYSLRPSDAKALQDARVVFWVGEGLETFLVKPLEALSGNAIVVRLSEAEGAHVLAAREGGTWERHGHGEQEGHELETDHPEPASEAHGRDRSDMHLWLDPHNAEAMVDAIVAVLSDADPDNGATYRDNGGELREQLAQLDQSLSGRLEPVADRPFVVFHDAYQYLEDRYGLNAVGTISVDPGRRPGARRLAEIQRKLSELDAACVFAEPQFEPALVDTVIEGTSAKKGVLDPLGADFAAGPDQYFVLMNALADSLVDCLGTANSSG
jgi:zinc transport system substrate-binding protein